MNLHKMVEICLKDDNMHRFVMINALICINIYIITCINSMLSGYALETAVRVLNVLPSKSVTSTPYEIWKVKKSDFSYFIDGELSQNMNTSVPSEPK